MNEAQITLYQYDKRGLVTKEINATKDETIYVYDGWDETYTYDGAGQKLTQTAHDT